MVDEDAGADGSEGFQAPDVRRILPELRAKGSLVLDAVPWHDFHHAYGPADDVPQLLRSLSGSDAEHVSQSLGELWNKVRHQGGSSASAALVVPFLIRLAIDPATHHRADVLLLAAEAGHRNHFGRDRRDDLLQVAEPPGVLRFDNYCHPEHRTLQAAREAITADALLLIPLLDDADSAVRTNAAYALAAALAPPPHVDDAIRARLAVEQDEPVRISLVLAQTQLALERADTEAIVSWTERLWADEENSIDVRFAAALAWLCATSAEAPLPLLRLLIAATTPIVEQWMQRVPWPDDIAWHGGLAAWLHAFLGDAPETEARLTTGFVLSPQPDIAESALLAAYDVACTWRSRSLEMIDLMADHLGHADPAVRRAAARHLACAGDLPGRVADRLADAIPDGEVRAWAALALAHCGDARAVSPLSELLYGSTCPWPLDFRQRLSGHPAQRLIDRLHRYAEELLPAALHWLAASRPDDLPILCSPVGGDLLDGLEAWGERAVGAVGGLTHRLATAGTGLGTARVLARIGPAAAPAVPALDALAARTRPNDLGILVWARWKITGERTEATAAQLAQLATIPPNGPESLRLLADLGLAAAPHEPTIRAALTDEYFWVQVEAAYALWRATGDVAESLPVLLDVLADRSRPSRFDLVHATITGYLAEFGAAAHAATPVLTGFLDGDHRAESSHPTRHDPISWDQHCQHLAITALHRIDPDAYHARQAAMP